MKTASDINYGDTGCNFSPSCLNCSLPICVEDLEGSYANTLRRQRIIKLVEDGKSNEEIATEYGVSLRTIQRELAKRDLLVGILA